MPQPTASTSASALTPIATTESPTTLPLPCQRPRHPPIPPFPLLPSVPGVTIMTIMRTERLSSHSLAPSIPTCPMPEEIIEPPQQLRIIQLNVNKSNDAQTDFLINRISPHHYDLVMIQEPYFDFKKDSRVSSKWIAIYPLNHINNPQRTRSMILVNAKISTNTWTALSVDCPDITAIRITGPWGVLRIFNIYNDITHARNTDALNKYLMDSKRNPRP
jgi:hypothetical protein